MFENPDKFRLCIDQDDLQYYADLSEHNILRGRNREKFLFAMVYGYKNNADIPLENRDTGGYWRFFQSESMDRALVFSVSLKKDNDIVVNSEKDLWDVIHKAEEYAHGGIRMLKNLWESVPHNSYWQKLEQNLHEELKSIEFKEIEE